MTPEAANLPLTLATLTIQIAALAFNLWALLREASLAVSSSPIAVGVTASGRKADLPAAVPGAGY
jgi:hypothetical protein